MDVSLVKDVSSIIHKLPLDTPSAQDSEEYALAGAITAAYRLVSENPLERSPEIEQGQISSGGGEISSDLGDGIVDSEIAGRDQVGRSIRYQR